MVEYVILVIGVLIRTVCEVVPGADVRVIEQTAGVTVMVPVAVIKPQPPVSVTV
jgi:hypothetical protein